MEFALATSTSISAPSTYWYTWERRKISTDDIKDHQTDVMPGFRLTWHYNKEPGQTNYRTDHGSKFKR